MIHDELLARLDKEPFLRWQNVDGKRNDRGPVDAAIRAVVELHKPKMGKKFCKTCGKFYPCSTIETIKKELN
jgi:hypothetical protein